MRAHHHYRTALHHTSRHGTALHYPHTALHYLHTLAPVVFVVQHRATLYSCLWYERRAGAASQPIEVYAVDMSGGGMLCVVTAD